MTTQQWPADKVERRSVSALLPYAKNARTHSEDQIKQIARSIGEFGFTNPVLIDEAGTIIAGHGRVLAARKIGLKEVPVMVAEGWTEEQRRAYVIADNQLALNAGWDEGLLREELMALGEEGFDLTLTGFDDAKLVSFVSLGEDEDGGLGEEDPADPYTRKIVAPIYEPTGDAPDPGELYDDAKARELIAEIRAAKLPKDVTLFLEKAAERHTVFHFRRIADFYASAPAETQRLMERSALVIIDFNQAIENGFVRLTKKLGDLVTKDHPDDYDDE